MLLCITVALIQQPASHLFGCLTLKSAGISLSFGFQSFLCFLAFFFSPRPASLLTTFLRFTTWMNTRQKNAEGKLMYGKNVPKSYLRYLKTERLLGQRNVLSSKNLRFYPFGICSSRTLGLNRPIATQNRRVLVIVLNETRSCLLDARDRLHCLRTLKCFNLKRFVDKH